jgi:O-antigen ligase
VPGSAITYSLPVVFLILLYFRSALAFLLPASLLEYANLAVLLSAVLAFAAQAGTRAPWIDRLDICWTGLFFLLILASASASGSPQDVLKDSLHEAVTIGIVYMVFSATARTDKGLQAICVTLTLCAAANAAVALWGAMTHQRLFDATREMVGVGAFGYDPETGRSGGIQGENYAGMWNSASVIGGMALWQARKYRPAALALILLGVMGTVISMSRTSVLSCAGAVVTFLLVTVRKRRSRPIGSLILLGVFTAGIGLLTYTTYFAALGVGLQKGMAPRWSQEGVRHDPRLNTWAFYLKDVAASPILGKGPGYILTCIRSGFDVPHNSFLDVAVEFGIPALMLFSIALLRPVAHIGLAARDVRLAYLYACFAGAVISLMTLSQPFGRLQWVLSGALIGAQRVALSRYNAADKWRGAAISRERMGFYRRMWRATPDQRRIPNVQTRCVPPGPVSRGTSSRLCQFHLFHTDESFPPTSWREHADGEKGVGV